MILFLQINQVAEVEQVSPVSLKRCVSALELGTINYAPSSVHTKFWTLNRAHYIVQNQLCIIFCGNGAVSQWRVCHQWGLTHLVFAKTYPLGQTIGFCPHPFFRQFQISCTLHYKPLDTVPPFYSPLDTTCPLSSLSEN